MATPLFPRNCICSTLCDRGVAVRIPGRFAAPAFCIRQPYTQKGAFPEANQIAITHKKGTEAGKVG